MSVIVINEETVAVVEVAEQGPPGVGGPGGGGGAVASVNGQTGTVVLTTSNVAEGSNQYFTTARVLAVVLAGLSIATNAAITSADTVLVGLGKLQAQINSIISSLASYVTPSGAATLTNKTISGSANTITNIAQSSITNLTADLALKADLVAGKVPSSQLPSFVDDVVEAANFAALPGTGETGKIYVTLSDNKTYRWSGSAYVEISASPGSTDAVSEGASNLYFTVARVLSSVLSGLGAGTNTAISAADSIIGALAKLQNQINNRAAAIHGHAISDVTGLQSALDGKENSISIGTTSQYLRGDKSWQTLNKAAVGLANVDNTSDATKNAATATLTNKTISGASNTLSSIPQSAVTNLASDLAGKQNALTLGAGVQTFLATPSSANLAAAITDEVGTGGLLFSDPTINRQTGTTYTLVSADNGKIVYCANASAITLTIPSGLGAGFNCVIVQEGAGQVTITAGAGVTLRQRNGLKTGGQWAAVSLFPTNTTNEFLIAGDTAT